MARAGRKVEILSIDGKREKVRPAPSVCQSCGMHIEHPREFHPHAACLMFRSCLNGGVVRATLQYVIDTAQGWTRAKGAGS